MTVLLRIKGKPLFARQFPTAAAAWAHAAEMNGSIRGLEYEVEEVAQDRMIDLSVIALNPYRDGLHRDQLSHLLAGDEAAQRNALAWVYTICSAIVGMNQSDTTPALVRTAALMWDAYRMGQFEEKGTARG